MKDNDGAFPCPCCGRVMPQPAQVNMDCLRILLTSQIVPALVHDVGHEVDRLEMHRHVIEKELGSGASEQLRAVLDQDENSLRRVHHFLRSLWGLHRGEELDAVVPLEELPKRLEWFCRLCEFPAPVDFGPLKQSQGQVSLQVYWDAFCYAVQGALLAIRRDRNPEVRIEFVVHERELTTSLIVTRESLPQPRPVQWRAVEWLMRSAGFAARIETDGHGTVLQWSVPIK